MRNIIEDLNSRREAIHSEREMLERRLQNLAKVEQALNVLIAEESLLPYGAQLGLPMPKSVNGNHAIGRTPVSKFLIEALTDQTAHPLKSLAELAVSRGLDFQGKNPSRVLHFALIGLQRNGYAKMVSKSVWQLTAKALAKKEQPPPEQGNGVNK